MRLIDEQDAYDVLSDYYHHSTDTQHAALREALGRVESVDAVPVRHGRWIPKFNGAFKGGAYWFECSKCRRTVPVGLQSGYNFCPECGTKMDGKEVDNGKTD